jgi:DNA-binding MarR family transcriptional regulator
MSPAVATETSLQEQVISFVRAFGLHRPDATPCGKAVPVSQAHTLLELSKGVRSQGELAALLRLERSTVSRLVQQLERRGWVDRDRDPGDGRARLLSLTEDGRRVADDITMAREAKFAALVEAIPPDERDAVLRALDVLIGAMNGETHG